MEKSQFTENALTILFPHFVPSKTVSDTGEPGVYDNLTDLLR
jgi:hypothetical protein